MTGYDVTGREVTIVIPHFETRELIKVCLRSIRRFTRHLHRVIVLDNSSQDDSLDYLRSVDWIELVESGVEPHLYNAHCESLNLAMGRLETPLVLIMHSDTLVLREGWLGFLVRSMQRGGFAAVGSRHQRVHVMSGLKSWLAGMPMALWRPFASCGKLRSLCGLYRTELLQGQGETFRTSNAEDVNHWINHQLLEEGHSILGIPRSVLGRYLCHLGAMTPVLNQIYQQRALSAGELVASNESFVTPEIEAASMRMYQRYLELPETQRILSDASLDKAERG